MAAPPKQSSTGKVDLVFELNHSLAEVFDQLDMKISIKTRSGKYDQEEFEELLDIYNQYPLEELILHPRVQQDY